jgi:UDP-N-acetylglucosamine 2-epimerase (hydrolysing)
LTETQKRLIYITGTRADFGKLRSLIEASIANDAYEVHIFVTGMHMLRKYGYTMNEIEKRNYQYVHTFINQNQNDTMDSILGKTISGLSDYCKEVQPDMIIIHGDRVEAMAGAIVGSLNNILVGHIEGGELSGTVDDLLRHATTKLSHIHFATNQKAKRRLVQLGEHPNSIRVIGSPDVDIIKEGNLPSLKELKDYYHIPFNAYSVMIFHPVTTERADIPRQAKELVDAMITSQKNYVVIFPNNDHGNNDIIKEYERLKHNNRFLIFPSMRFEYYLALIKNADFMIGNSSSGLMEAPYFGTPAINLGSRQDSRDRHENVIDSPLDQKEILNTIKLYPKYRKEAVTPFGEGNSADLFMKLLTEEGFWSTSPQKKFFDLPPQT